MVEGYKEERARGLRGCSLAVKMKPLNTAPRRIEDDD